MVAFLSNMQYHLLDACRQNSIGKLICLGGFENERKDFSWEGFKLELDATKFAHGTVYEIEVETVRLLPDLECILSYTRQLRTDVFGCCAGM